jgi:hypothetical protein
MDFEIFFDIFDINLFLIYISINKLNTNIKKYLSTYLQSIYLKKLKIPNKNKSSIFKFIELFI